MTHPKHAAPEGAERSFYDEIFRSIQAATKIQGGNAIGVSVQAFKEELTKRGCCVAALTQGTRQAEGAGMTEDERNKAFNEGRAFEAERLAALAASAPAPEAGWPKLDKPASIGVGSFGKGVSSFLLVEAAQRLYERNIAERNKTPEQRVQDEINRRAMWDLVNGPLPASPSPDTSTGAGGQDKEGK